MRIGRVWLWMSAAEAFLWLALAWLVVDVLPGHLYRKLLPLNRRKKADAEAPLAPAAAIRMATVRRAVWAASRRMPVRSVCIHRAIAAYRMLRLRAVPCTIHSGVAKNDDGSLHAHIWVTSDGRDVVGLADAAGYTELDVPTAQVWKTH